MTNAIKKRLHDVLEAGRAIREFTEGAAFTDYECHRENRSAVERPLEIVGEALAKAVPADPTLAEHVPELPQMIGMRN